MGISLAGEYDSEAQTNESIRPGVYQGSVIEAKREPVSKNDIHKGDSLVLTWELSDKRLLWQRIMIWYNGPDAEKAATARRIASAQLADIAEATTGKREIADTDDLLHRPCQLTVDIRQANGRDYNEVKKVTKVGGAPPTAVGSSSSSANSAPARQPAASPGKSAGNRFAAAKAARAPQAETATADEIPS